MLGLIEKYRELLPVTPADKLVSLQEGSTPLYHMPRLAAELAIDCELYAKYEGANPTGSFKDRGMTVAVTKAYSEGKTAVICASTGNTSASAAAYAAKAGMKALVIIPEGHIAYGKLAQALAYGARVLQISGNFDRGLELVQAICKVKPICLVNSVNPYRLEGQKTIAFEVVDELGMAPDYHYLPVGNAGNIAAHWQGYLQYQKLGKIASLPIMVGYQASGAAPFVVGQPIANPETIATAIRIGNPASWDLALSVQKQSGGWFGATTDEAILDMQQLIARTEGIFCEPASAVSIAGLLKDWQQGKIVAGSTIVCTLTGNGMKDPDIIIEQCQGQLKSVPAELEAIVEIMEAK